jgi:hypothetical protein
MKEKVIAILAAHDSLRAHERGDFKAYLNTVFAQAEQVPALTSRVAALEAEVAAAQAANASLSSRVAALEAAQAKPAA